MASAWHRWQVGWRLGCRGGWRCCLLVSLNMGMCAEPPPAQLHCCCRECCCCAPFTAALDALCSAPLHPLQATKDKTGEVRMRGWLEMAAFESGCAGGVKHRGSRACTLSADTDTQPATPSD